MRYIKPRIKAVQPAAGIDDPAAVAAPAVIAFRIVAVCAIQGDVGSGTKINHVKIRIMMPNSEAAVVRFGEEQEPAIG